MLSTYIKIPVKTLLFEEETFSENSIKPVRNQSNISVFEKHKSLTDAIKQNIDLLLTSQEGELHFDKLFGLEVWNHNFESKKLKHDERKWIEEEIIRDLNVYEKRLKKNSHIVEVQFKNEIKLLDGRKAKLHILEIKIKSVLNEEFKSRDTAFFHTLAIPVKIYYTI